MIRQYPSAPLRGLVSTAFAIVALAVTTVALAQDLVEGRNYARIKNPQPVETGKRPAPASRKQPAETV